MFLLKCLFLCQHIIARLKNMSTLMSNFSHPNPQLQLPQANNQFVSPIHQNSISNPRMSQALLANNTITNLLPSLMPADGADIRWPPPMHHQFLPALIQPPEPVAPLSDIRLMIVPPSDPTANHYSSPRIGGMAVAAPVFRTDSKQPNSSPPDLSDCSMFPYYCTHPGTSKQAFIDGQEVRPPVSMQMLASVAGDINGYHSPVYNNDAP